MDYKGEKFWRQLEILALLYIAEEIRSDIPKDVRLTQEQKDDGYDGKVVIRITENSDIIHTVMMEAKYRKTVKTLPFQDCAKALIIAFNQAVQTLFLVTNVAFSPQALQETGKFISKINLRVIEVDAAKLRRYIVKNEDRVKSLFDADFIDSILHFSQEDHPVSVMTQTSPSNFATSCNQEQTETRNEDIIIKSKNFIQNAATMQRYLDMTNPYIIVQGMGGVGKSVFIREIMKANEFQNKSVHYLDMQQCLSPRILFIRILEALWGRELASIITKSNTEEAKKEFRELIEYTSDGRLDDSMIQTVVQAIYMDYSASQGHTDTYNFFLSDFICKLLYPYRNRNRFLFVFGNLNKGEMDTLDFLYALLCKMQGLVSIIVELRTPFVLEADQKNIRSSEEYYNKLMNVANITYKIILESFSFQDVCNYLKEKQFPFSRKQCRIFFDRVGEVPLFVSVASSFLRNELKRRKIQENAVPDSLFDKLMENFSGSNLSILNTIVNYYRLNPTLSDAFDMALLLHGEIPHDFLDWYFGADAARITDSLLYTSLFLGLETTIKVKHNLIYDSIHGSIDPNRRTAMARKLLNYLPESTYYTDNLAYMLYEMNYHAENHAYVLDWHRQISRQLVKENQYNLLIKYSEYALQMLDYVPDEAREAKVLITILFAYAQLHIFNAQPVQEYLHQLEMVMEELEEADAYSVLYLWACWIQWYFEFYTGKIQDSLNTITQAKQQIDFDNNIDDILGGQIYWAYGLSHKRVTTLAQGIADMKNGMKKYPGSILLKSSICLHEAHSYLRQDPQKTFQMCSDLIKIVENSTCYFNEILQVRVDAAMAAFYAGDYNYSKKEAQKDYEIARSNNIAYQEGRTLNILAANQLVLLNTEKALETFKKSYHTFQTSGNLLFLWRPSFNIAQIYNKTGRVEEALKCYERIVNIEMKNVEERKDTLSIENSELVCLLHIIRVFNQAGLHEAAKQIQDRYGNASWDEYLLLTDEEFLCTLERYSYVHNEYILILG